MWLIDMTAAMSSFLAVPLRLLNVKWVKAVMKNGSCSHVLWLLHICLPLHQNVLRMDPVLTPLTPTDAFSHLPFFFSYSLSVFIMLTHLASPFPPGSLRQMLMDTCYELASGCSVFPLIVEELALCFWNMSCCMSTRRPPGKIIVLQFIGWCVNFVFVFFCRNLSI